jgi:DNA-binding LacI/PurR family transcriptional regulator
MDAAYLSRTGSIVKQARRYQTLPTVMATIKDVAHRAGVAPSTVSYALSGKRSISKEARERIAQAIEELDFTPSALGRQLAHSRSNMIGLVFPVREMELESETLEFLPITANLLHKHGYGLSLFTGHMTPEQILNLYRNNTVDGLILMQINRQDARVDILRDKGYPLTLIGRCNNMRGLSYVDFDAAHAAYLLFEHLHRLGHRTIGYLDHTPAVHRDNFGYAWLVRQGYKHAMKAFAPHVMCEPATDTIEGSYAATQKLLRREPGITAIVTLARYTPVGAQRALNEDGRRVPEDCSLIGITSSTIAKMTTPQLTSADIPLNDMVRAGAELLLQQLNGNHAVQRVVFPAELVLRESTTAVQR